MDELNGYCIEDLSVGMSDIFAKTVTEADIVIFAGVSGDMNPVHINRIYAEGTMFKAPIAHGILIASFISTVLGTRLPGPGSIYLSQNLRFRAPVKIGDTVVARATVKELQVERRRAVLDTVCTVGEQVVIDGEATVMVPTRAG